MMGDEGRDGQRFGGLEQSTSPQRSVPLLSRPIAHNQNCYGDGMIPFVPTTRPARLRFTKSSLGAFISIYAHVGVRLVDRGGRLNSSVVRIWIVPGKRPDFTLFIDLIRGNRSGV